MARPPTPPTAWASTGSKIAPSAGKQAAGWTVNERPPAEWINWLDNNRDAWLAFVSQVTSGQPIADLLLNFANTDMFAALIDVTTTAPASGYRLVFRAAATPQTRIRIYIGNATRRLMITSNAVWGGSSWLSDAATANSLAFALVNDGTTPNAIQLLYKAATGATWLDSAWTNGDLTVGALHSATLQVINTATIGVINVGTLNAGGINVPSGTADLDTLTATDLTLSGSLTAPSATINGDLAVNTLHVTQPHLYLAPSADIVHSPPASSQPYRWVCQPLGNYVKWSGGTITYDGTYGSIKTTNGAGVVSLEYPLDIPRETLRITAYVVWQSATVPAANKLRLYRWTRQFIGGGTIMVLPDPAAQIGITLTQGVIAPTGCLMDSATFDYPFDPTLERYAFVVELPDGTANYLYSVRLGFADPGPRNG